ncbi:hypothetical protein P691DRAFT_812721 [Macrolepiota fuliginosa MF-IS2]|uniref:Pheromone n=1 Tax=Macrolepiota fuliginosa MF-IS2 TaxID=1400762 RepID=A0A9P5WYZ9_9AGAR|nr:hypothetical protein P691DRAFT_812721 [Macrolepiota fuliginosa MF-IS2]
MIWDTFNPFDFSSLINDNCSTIIPTDTPHCHSATSSEELLADYEVRYGGGASWVCVIG